MSTTTTKMKCLIIDDEAIAIEGILNYIEKLDFLEVVATPSSAIEAGEILKTTGIDLMFLDINMPHLSGLDFLESLENPPLTILTTAYSEYALEGYRLNVIDYLLKPIGFKRFFQAASKAHEAYNSKITTDNKGNEDTSLYIRQGDSFVKIQMEDILYIEGMQNYAKIYFADKNLIIHQTMTFLEETLPTNLFYRIHRSYLINLNKIDTIISNRLFIGKKELPISTQRKEGLLNLTVYKKLISK